MQIVDTPRSFWLPGSPWTHQKELTGCFAKLSLEYVVLESHGKHGMLCTNPYTTVCLQEETFVGSYSSFFQHRCPAC